MIPSSEEVIKSSKLHRSRIKNIYCFGSRVYDTTSVDSDWDFIMVANTSTTNQEIKSGRFNIHVQTEDQFLKNLKEHHSSTVEAFFTPSHFRIKEEVNFNWSPSIPSLRHSFSHISSNSWVKCKKKIEQGDYYIGVKSLFHSLRIPMFGIQIIETGRIYNFSEANFIYNKIMSKNWTWEELDSEFKPLRNSILSKFRSITQK